MTDELQSDIEGLHEIIGEDVDDRNLEVMRMGSPVVYFVILLKIF